MAKQVTGPDPATLRSALDEFAERGARMLRSKASTEGHHRGLARHAALLLAGPGLILLVQLLQSAAGARVWDPSAAQLIIAVLAPWMLGSVASAMRAGQRAVSRAQAIALFDSAVGADERLVAADELLQAGAEGPFAAAALEDARWFVRPARAMEMPTPAPDLSRAPRERNWIFACAAGGLALALFAALLGGDPARVVPAPRDAVPAVVVADGGPTPVEAPRGADDPEPPQPADAPEGAMPSDAGEAEAAAKPAELPDEAKRKEGVGGSGRSSRAENSRGMSDARGAPTNQGQESKKPATKKPLKPDAKKKSRKKKPFTKPPEAKKSVGEESGSTTGRGSSRGSNKNAVTSDWTSKDQVTTEEDEEVEDDEDVEDETSDSEARGGVQPNLRDRKPPVSRDLGIGFGNQPNPNANGRGGPSQPKKSRGTASLVLGVPIPDRVKGQPNPGKTKVTQERVEPRRERAGGAQAQPRTPRSGPSTVLASPEITGWLRDLVRTYFLELRNKESKTR